MLFLCLACRRRTNDAKQIDLQGSETAKVLTLLMDQGPIGLGMSSFLHFYGVQLVHVAFDPYHRLIRDLKLDVLGVGPKELRKKLLQAQLCSSYLWTLNYRPYGSGGFAAAKKELLEEFLLAESEDNTVFEVLAVSCLSIHCH